MTKKCKIITAFCLLCSVGVHAQQTGDVFQGMFARAQQFAATYPQERLICISTTTVTIRAILSGIKPT